MKPVKHYLTTRKLLNMSIVDFKKRISTAQSNLINENSVVKKLEVISNFKSTPTIIARDLRIEGELSSSGLVEIEGYIKGIIKGNSVVVREDGCVEGTIIAESLSIRGRFEGTIRAKSLNIASKAKIIGNIEYDLLSVEDGACIDGQFKRMEKS